MLRFPFKFLNRKKGLGNEYINDLYRLSLAASCDTDNKGRSNRSTHYIKRFHSSHFKGLSSRLFEFTQEGVDQLYQNLMNEGDSPMRLNMLVQRYSSSSTFEPDQRLL